MSVMTEAKPSDTAASGVGGPGGYEVRQAFGRRIELLAPGDAEPTVYRYERGLPKPCVHPLCTPSGACLSGFEMSDHVWHRGLWFAIKYLNRVNFWEENEQGCGVQVGEAEPTVTLPSASSARIEHRLRWESPKTGVALLERRTLTFTRLDEASRQLDWQTELTPRIDLELDRTPFTTWGGYGGLSLRGSRELHRASLTLADGSTTDQVAGDRHAWCLMHGRVDGGPDRSVSFGMVDHPDNVRSPSPWYGKTRDFSYVNAAFLFHEPMSLNADQALRLRYRVLYRDGVWPADGFAERAAAYRDRGDGA